MRQGPILELFLQLLLLYNPLERQMGHNVEITRVSTGHYSSTLLPSILVPKRDSWRGDTGKDFLILNLVSPKQGCSFFKVMLLLETVSKMDPRFSFLLLTSETGGVPKIC